ncbi:MAG: hypothetical protein O3A51_07750 [Verrucomicrobia bacterium]|nr:hypothetical protein [Verrucomicrobiota bacterium]
MASVDRITIATKRLSLILVAILVAIGAIELACCFWPVKGLMDNPWYVMVSDDALAKSRDLPFERPAHFAWTGSSRGDLAVIHGDRDPYARTVSFKTDYQGFRNDRDITSADIVCIGDSYTEAGNIPTSENYVSRLAQVLNLTTRNLGRALYAPSHELIVLKKFGLANGPKIVVWQIAEANDLIESLDYALWLQSGKPYFTHRGETPITRTEAWRRRSPIFRMYARFRQPRPYPITGNFVARDQGDTPIRFLEMLPGPEQMPRNHLGLPTMSEALEEGIALLKRAGIPVVILLIPMKFTVMEPYTEMAEQTRAALTTYQPIPDEERMAEQLRLYCEFQEVTYVDATEALQQATAAGELVYLPYDTHLAPRGHEIIADLLAEAIRPLLVETNTTL